MTDTEDRQLNREEEETTTPLPVVITEEIIQWYELLGEK